MARSPKIVVSRRPDGQQGLFAAEQISKHEVLIVYEGEILSAPTRTSMQIDEDRHIEGTPETNAFLNHACAPTAWVDFSGLCLRARRDIEPGEEITLDYNTADYELHEKFTCHCGAPACLGEIRGFKYLPLERKLLLEPWLAPYLRRKLAAELTANAACEHRAVPSRTAMPRPL